MRVSLPVGVEVFFELAGVEDLVGDHAFVLEGGDVFAYSVV